MVDKNNIIVICFSFCLFIMSFASATNISTCSTISSAGSYDLISSLNCAGNGILISHSDVILNCNGNTINYSSSVYETQQTSYAINISANSSLTSVTLLLVHVMF